MRSRFVFNIAFAVAFGCILPLGSFAISPAEYLSNIGSARAVVDQMLADLTSSDVSLQQFDAKKIVELRRLMPSESSIETEHGPQTVSNAWLHFRLDEFITEKDLIKRAAILNGIDERLAAIAKAVDDLETAARSDRTKDEDKQKLTEILAREQFQKPSENQQSIWESWLKSLMEWLEKMFPRPSGGPAKTGGIPGLAQLLQIVIIVGVIGLILFIVYKLAPGVFPSFKRRSKGKMEQRVILGETISSDRTSGDLMAEAENLARQGEIRAAIRKGYIAFLFELAERRQIGLARHKTNRDYLRDVRREPVLFDGMRGLTGIFEASWYGSRAVGDETWQRFKSGYNEALAQKQG